jgi:hypothetical protein
MTRPDPARPIEQSFGSIRREYHTRPEWEGRTPRPDNRVLPKPQTVCIVCGGEPWGRLDGEAACHIHATLDSLPNRSEGGPSASAGMVANNVGGVSEDGKRPPGAAGWEYRPPHAQPSEHADLEIVLGSGDARRLMYQQRPPVHVSGSAPGSPRDVRRQVRGMSEARAQRIALGEAARGLGSDVGRLAEVTGMHPMRVARRKGGGR